MNQHSSADARPWITIPHLDHLWFQVAGTLCNLTCPHCFISCSPKNDSFGFLTLAEVQRRLEESVPLGVKEYYFTGGEPFLNPDMTAILVETLRYGPATVLTNGTVLKDEWLAALRAADDASRYSLEFRVSIDGCSPEMNDPIRGAGTFARAMRGVATAGRVRLPADHHGRPHLAAGAGPRSHRPVCRGPPRCRLRPAAAQNPADAAAGSRGNAHPRLFARPSGSRPTCWTATTSRSSSATTAGS